MSIELMTVFQSWRKRVCHDCTAEFLLQDFSFFLCIHRSSSPAPSIPPDLESGNDTAFRDQFNMDCQSENLANILNFSSVENLHVMHSVSLGGGNKPLPSDFICMRNSVKFSLDPSPWEAEYRPRFTWTILSSWKLLSAVGILLVVSLLLFLSLWVVAVE